MKTKKTVSMKAVVLLMAVVLLIGCTVGGSLAWLATKTTPVTNTFSASNIEITLTETTGNEYKLIPGKTYAKDPVVAVTDNTDVDCYLFIKIEENNAGNFLSYELNLEGWEKVEDGVYARKVKTTDTTKSWYLLKGITGYENGYVKVQDTLELANMSTAGDSYLTFTAYAVQTLGFEDNVAGAWAEAEKLDDSSSGN